MEKQIKDATKKIVEYYQKPIHLIVEGADDLSKKVIIEGVAQTIPTKEVLVITVRPVMLDKLQNMYRGICNIHCKSLRNLLKDKSILSSYAMLIVDDILEKNWISKFRKTVQARYL